MGKYTKEQRRKVKDMPFCPGDIVTLVKRTGESESARHWPRWRKHYVVKTCKASRYCATGWIVSVFNVDKGANLDSGWFKLVRRPMLAEPYDPATLTTKRSHKKKVSVDTAANPFSPDKCEPEPIRILVSRGNRIQLPDILGIPFLPEQVLMDCPKCPRCGGSHPKQKLNRFHKFFRPSTTKQVWQYWFMCPVTVEPVLLSIYGVYREPQMSPPRKKE